MAFSGEVAKNIHIHKFSYSHTIFIYKYMKHLISYSFQIFILYGKNNFYTETPTMLTVH